MILPKRLLMKSLRGKPRGIMFLGFNLLLSQHAAGNETQKRLKWRDSASGNQCIELLGTIPSWAILLGFADSIKMAGK